MGKIKSLWSLVRETLREFTHDKGTRLAAALAFYASLAIAPLFIIAVGIAGIFFGQKAAEGRIIGELARFIGSSAAEQIQTIVENARDTSSGITAIAIGTIFLLWGA